MQSLAGNFNSPETLVNECQLESKFATHSLYIFENDVVLTPGAASASHEDHRVARKILTKLAADKKNEVWVISGQTLEYLQKKYGDIPNINLAGGLGGRVLEHGKDEKFYYEDLRIPTGELGYVLLQKAWDEEVQFNLPGSIIFNHQGKNSAHIQSVHTRMQELAEPRYKYENYKDFAELTHKSCHKGRLVSDLLQKYTAGRYFVIAFGGAKTDDPVFRALEKHSQSHGDGKTVSVFVGPDDEISADRRLKNHYEVYQLFVELLGIQ